MYYTVYQITNKINTKTYIGKHQTKDLNDKYMGSGKLLKRAIKKYGKENFVKEILFVFDNEQDMNSKEKELVVISENTYNLCPGGHGGFGYINENKLNGSYEGRIKSGKRGRASLNEKLLNEQFKKEYSKKLSEAQKLRFKLNPNKPNKGSLNQKLSVETRKKMSVSKTGTYWITNGKNNKLIKQNQLEQYISLGFYKGRTKLGPIA